MTNASVGWFFCFSFCCLLFARAHFYRLVLWSYEIGLVAFCSSVYVISGRPPGRSDQVRLIGCLRCWVVEFSMYWFKYLVNLCGGSWCWGEDQTDAGNSFDRTIWSFNNDCLIVFFGDLKRSFCNGCEFCWWYPLLFRWIRRKTSSYFRITSFCLRNSLLKFLL